MMQSRCGLIDQPVLDSNIKFTVSLKGAASLRLLFQDLWILCVLYMKATVSL